MCVCVEVFCLGSCLRKQGFCIFPKTTSNNGPTMSYQNFPECAVLGICFVFALQIQSKLREAGSFQRAPPFGPPPPAAVSWSPHSPPPRRVLDGGAAQRWDGWQLDWGRSVWGLKGVPRSQLVTLYYEPQPCHSRLGVTVFENSGGGAGEDSGDGGHA